MGFLDHIKRGASGGEKKDGSENDSAAATEDTETTRDSAHKDTEARSSGSGLLDHIKSAALFCASKQDAKESDATEETDRNIENDDTAASNASTPTDNGSKNDEEKKSLRPLHMGSYNFEDDNNPGYTYPSLFEEADDMVKLSNLIYTLIEMRDLVRSGAFDDRETTKQIMELPLPMDKALSIIATEAETLKEKLSDGAHEEALSALHALMQGSKRTLENVGGSDAIDRSNPSNETKPQTNNNHQPKDLFGGMLDMWHSCFPTSPSTPSTSDDKIENYTVSTITAVGDEKSNDELVYVAGINPASKRITVAFRGSTTMTDFLTDAKMDMVKVPDPRHFFADATKSFEKDEIDEDICIHQGFYEYLFGDKTSKKTSKFEEIMAHVQALFDSNPIYRSKYKLYVTGHSLGGALATLFGFYACSSPKLPKPISVISVASPRVGNLEFARTFTEFESNGVLRHLRIANHKDPVTLGPTVSHKRALTLATMALSPLGYLALKLSGRDTGAEETYYHAGMNMKLRKEGEQGADGGAKGCELSYSGASILSREVGSDAGADEEVSGRKSVTSSKLGASDLPLASYHFGSTYAERMALVESDLNGLTLNKLYKEKSCKI